MTMEERICERAILYDIPLYRSALSMLDFVCIINLNVFVTGKRTIGRFAL